MKRNHQPMIILAAAVAVVLACASVAPCQTDDDDLGIVVTTREEDARLRLAQHAKESVERAEEIVAEAEELIIIEMDKAFIAVNKTLDQIQRYQQEDPNGMVRAHHTFDAFKAAAVELLKLAKNLQQRQEGYKGSLKSLKTAMETAPAAFREAAKAFRAYAEEDEKYADIRADYLMIAEVWDTLASKLEDRSGELVPDTNEIVKTLDYVSRTAIFLERLVAHLDAIPQLETLGNHPKYLEQLQRYIKSFEKMREQMRTLHNDICTEAVSSNLRAKPPIQIAQQRDDRQTKPARPQTPLPMHRHGAPVPAGVVYGSYVSPASYNFRSR